ncbi:MAG: ATPase P [Candidatus Pelethousia sp.]|nr:ATPase P [Candidatus Pelethousia sp.]
MIKIDIPGRETLTLHHLVVDYNGTIARDGKLIEDVAACFEALRAHLQIHILTADTYGTVQEQCKGLPAQVCTFPVSGAAEHKARFVQELGPGVVCLGNGFNDMKMLQAADLAIAVLDREGLCAGLLAHADILVTSAADGLGLLLHTDRPRATLRS